MTLVLGEWAVGEEWKYFIMLLLMVVLSGEFNGGGTSEQTVSTHLFLFLWSRNPITPRTISRANRTNATGSIININMLFLLLMEGPLLVLGVELLSVEEEEVGDTVLLMETVLLLIDIVLLIIEVVGGWLLVGGGDDGDDDGDCDGEGVCGGVGVIIEE